MKNRLFGYEKQTRFSFRKMSIGLISCGIGAFWIMGGTVMADEVTENTAESDIETVSTRTISEETTPVEVVKKSTVSIEKMSEQRELEDSAKQMIDLSEPHLKSKDVLEVGDTSVIPTVTTSASTEANRSITDEEAKTSEARLEETGVTNLRHVTIPEGVTEIGSSAFSDNPQLTKITLPSSLKKIGHGAFYGTNLTSIDLPEGLEEIGSEAFSGTKLTELVLPSSLKRIDAYAFRNISTLTKVHIPAHLESASNVFAYNYGDGTASPITEVSFESGIESIPSGLFDGVSSLTNVRIPSTVKRIGASAFSRTNLAEISIPEGVEDIGSSAFGNIERLKKVTLPSSVTNAYNAFSGSRKLTDVKLGAGFTKLPDGLLSGTGITEFVVPEGVTEIGSSAFSANPQLTKVTLPSSLKKIGSNAFNGTGLTSVAIPEGVTDIGSYAFSSTPLERIILPTGLKIIGSGAFRNTKLIEIEIPEGVEYLDDYTLVDNPQLKKVYLPKSITALVSRWGEQLPDAEFHVYLDSFALEYMMEHQLNFKLRDENVANDESKILDSRNSYYLPTTSSSRRQGYLGLDLKYSLKADKSSDDGTYKVKLNIPASTTIFDGKIRYNGTDIPVSVQDGYITIPVREKEGKLKLMLKSGNKELTNLRLFAQLAYQKDGQKVAEVIGATNVTVPVLTLTANKATSRTYSRISGVADPTDQVTAYLDGQSVGAIKVKKDGTYTLDIPLVNPVNDKEYTIKVVAISPEGHELAETTTVRFEEKLPELENFIMRHNGYIYNMKEHQGKAPVISFRPGGKFEFEVEYSHTSGNDSLYLVSTREGISKTIELRYDPVTEKYRYNGYIDEENHSYVPGKLSLYFERDVTPLLYEEEEMTRSSYAKFKDNDKDGDGFVDNGEGQLARLKDPDKEKWNVGDRDLAIFSILAYADEKDENGKNNFDKIFVKGSTRPNLGIKGVGEKVNGLDLEETDGRFFQSWKFLGQLNDPYQKFHSISYTIKKGNQKGVVAKDISEEELKNYKYKDNLKVRDSWAFHSTVSWFRDKQGKGENLVIAFRGTDEGGTVGPRSELLHDIQISFNNDKVRYLARNQIKRILSSIVDGDKIKNIYITGHSLGGYETYYAADEILSNDELEFARNKLKKVVSFNGPGIPSNNKEIINRLWKFKGSDNRVLLYYVDEPGTSNHAIVAGGLDNINRVTKHFGVYPIKMKHTLTSGKKFLGIHFLQRTICPRSFIIYPKVTAILKRNLTVTSMV